MNQWTKAGLMLREGTAPGSRHASIFVTPTTVKGMAFQRRREVNGLSLNTTGPAMTAPVWILLKRSGDLISVYYATELSGNPWILIGRDTLPGLAATVNVGLAVSSHVDGTLATARFRYLVLTDGPGWVLTASDIGAVGVPGNGNFSQTDRRDARIGRRHLGHGGRLLLLPPVVDRGRHGDGARPVAPADASLGEDGVDVPRNRWPRLAARDADRLGRQWRGDAVPRRNRRYLAQCGALDRRRAGMAASQRSGNTFTGYASEDGTTWRTIGSITLPLDLDTYLGVALTSHNNTTRATGVFDNLTMVR